MHSTKKRTSLCERVGMILKQRIHLNTKSLAKHLTNYALTFPVTLIREMTLMIMLSGSTTLVVIAFN